VATEAGTDRASVIHEVQIVLTKEQYLLTCLAEELTETAQEALKCVRFTPHHSWPQANSATNRDRLITEWSQVQVIVDALNLEGFEMLPNAQAMEDKRFALEHYRLVSQKMGVTI
jgi:hypothetical protein